MAFCLLMLNHNQQISENFEQAPGYVGYGVAIGPVLSHVQASSDH